MEFVFLHKNYYDTLKSRNLLLDDIVDLILEKKIVTKVSDFTRYLFIETNRFLNYSILDIKKNNVFINLNNVERATLEEKIKEIKTSESYEDQATKYYEFLRVSGDIILIVFSDGFVDFVTKSKEKYLEFLLNLLCYLYDIGLTSHEVIKNYILFKNKDTSIEYLKIKLV